MGMGYMAEARCQDNTLGAFEGNDSGRDTVAMFLFFPVSLLPNVRSLR